MKLLDVIADRARYHRPNRARHNRRLLMPADTSPAKCWCREASLVARWEEAGYAGAMPFKHNAARRHRIPRARFRVRNWRAYEAGLGRRGDLTLWVD